NDWGLDRTPGLDGAAVIGTFCAAVPAGNVYNASTRSVSGLPIFIVCSSSIAGTAPPPRKARTRCSAALIVFDSGAIPIGARNRKKSVETGAPGLPPLHPVEFLPGPGRLT